MFRALPALMLLTSLQPVFALTAADIGDAIQHVSLDPEQCYRVLDLNFNKEDIKVYLASGYLVFTKPISLGSESGARLGAVFVSSAEGGDADVLLLPPTRSERASLATFTHSPNLDEHFKSAVFVFTDGTGDELLARLQSDSASKKSSEMGGLLAEHWTPVLDNLVASFETRVVYDVLSREPKAGLFYMAVGGNQLDNFDVLYDPTVTDQILAGKLGYENNRTYFNTWTAFPARSARHGAARPGSYASLENIRIQATIQPDLTMQAVAQATLKPTAKLEPARPLSAIPFNLSPKMRITSATIDGQAVEVFDRASLRSNLIQGGEDRQFLLLSDPPLDPALAHQLEIRYEGGVIQDAGRGVYFVSSRGTWYPRSGGELANFDLTFRYPKTLTLAASGATVNDSVDGDWHVTHTKTEAPVRFAGFNLGNFQSLARDHKGYRIDLYANYELENALRPRAVVPDEPSPVGTLRRRRLGIPAPLPSEPPAFPADPTARMEELATNVTNALDFMTEQFGPIPIHHLAVTPIPGGFGQGFPGLVYLSTLAYLDPAELPSRVRARSEQTFYSELLATHELAHQWWGNLVVPASEHDDWLTEGLANYSALLLLERKKGIKAVEAVLDNYRTHLLTKTASGRTLESAGPIIWGLRLETSLTPDGWRAVTYEKGTWIIHMLRRQLGDEKFLALLRDIAANHHSLSTDEFRDLASRYASKSPDPELKNFFENWVQGTGLPAVKLSYSWRVPKLSISLDQRDVDDAFSAYLPVEVQTRNKTTVYWLPAGSDASAVSIPLKFAPLRVSLLTNDCLMTAIK